MTAVPLEDLNVPVRCLFGLPVHAATMAQAVDICERAITERRSMTVGVVNAAKVVNLRRDPALQAAVTSCDLLLADGQSVVWASRLLRLPLPERVAGIDLFTELLGRADTAGQRVYFLGGTQDVLDRVVDRVRLEHPGIRVAGAHHGYFGQDGAAHVAADISASAPDMLFVAMTSPFKEVFLDTWGPSLNARVCHGVGGSFDVLAGKTQRAPDRWQRMGLEWLYRVKQEPGRLWKRLPVHEPPLPRPHGVGAAASHACVPPTAAPADSATARGQSRQRRCRNMTGPRPLRVVVVGQGYVGLPLAMRAVEVGHDVVGFDVSETRVKRLNAAESYVEDVKRADLAQALASGRYHPRSSRGLRRLRRRRHHRPDTAAGRQPGPLLHRGVGAHPRSLPASGATVVLESTTYPGTTEELFAAILEEGSGLTAGTDFHLGYSAERIDPGNTIGPSSPRRRSSPGSTQPR